MCRVISVSSLDKKAKLIVDSFGGYGISPVEEEVRAHNKVLDEPEEAWELFVERDPIMLEGGIW